MEWSNSTHGHDTNGTHGTYGPNGINSTKMPNRKSSRAPGVSGSRFERFTQSSGHGVDRTQDFPRLSRPVELLRDTYDCVVIGSGYGGGVAASRMARAGQSVCLLERGKERWPGEYPSGSIDALKQLHITGTIAPRSLEGSMIEGGDPTGLYHLVLGKGINSVVGNGLGGTSLLNANVFLEADAETMKMPCWPKELQENNALKEYYQRAKDVLQPEEYPQDWPKLSKLTMLERQAKEVGESDNFKRVSQTTRFKAGPNSSGVVMNHSTLTGQDATGVNDGSKSTTLVNYLADAWNWGAEMFCQCEVRYIKKHPDTNEEGYLVFFAWHGSKRRAFKGRFYEDLMWVHAKKCVFLGAGSIGTTEILLRSKKLGLSMSDKVGKGMSGNGDILAFGYNTDTEVNAMGRQNPSPYKPVGPTITGMIDSRGGHENPLDGFIIQEGTIPRALAPIVQAMMEFTPGHEAPEGETFTSKLKRVTAQTGGWLLGPYFSKGSVEKSQVYLLMSHDSSQATLTLKDDKPLWEFLGTGRSDHAKNLNDLLKRVTHAVGGTLIQSPFYAAAGEQASTAHPLGGACMSSSGKGEDGVTNHFGEVYSGSGEETHKGLIVTDGSAIPASICANPFATITALAERSVEHVSKYRIMSPIDLETKNDTLDLFSEPHQYNARRRKSPRYETKQMQETTELVKSTRDAKTNGFEFSEVMSGHIHIGKDIQGTRREDYEAAAKTAKGLSEEAKFFLSLKSWDTHTTVNRADHKAMATGTFSCASLAKGPIMVHRGSFHLFNRSIEVSGLRNMIYDFDMTTTNGDRYHFHGFKEVDSSVALNPWHLWTVLTTLYVTISEAEGDQKVIGRGIMHVTPLDFLSTLLSFSPNGPNLISKVTSTISFLSFFAKVPTSLLLTPFKYQEYTSPTYTGYINDTAPDATYKARASDGVVSLLHMWESRNMDVEPINILMIPGSSVDHLIFAVPTIEVNAVNYLTRAGYRVFVSVHRICNLVPGDNNWTTYDSRLDLRACYERIRSQYGEEPVYTIAHCMGSVAYSTGMLDGTIPAEWVKGISCSQVFMNPVWSPLNMSKGLLWPISLDKVYSIFGGHYFSCSSTRGESWFQWGVNQVLRFYPTKKGEMCNNVSCHRCSLVFGRLWNHKNLNEATHRQTDRFFGGVNMTLLQALIHQGVVGHVSTNYPFTRLTTPSNISRLKGIPFLFFHGDENQVLSPESTEKTYDTLRRQLGGKSGGGEMYRRVLIRGYGHLDCWMGTKSYRDVFPVLRKEVDRVCRPEGYRYEEVDWEGEWMGWRDLPVNRGVMKEAQKEVKEEVKEEIDEMVSIPENLDTLDELEKFERLHKRVNGGRKVTFNGRRRSVNDIHV